MTEKWVAKVRAEMREKEEGRRRARLSWCTLGLGILALAGAAVWFIVGYGAMEAVYDGSGRA